ncbi:hypothetical protein AA21952_0867 [Acetobacter oeni LMG 21952]|nr:hypothetical protein AA21952_0867 [Acetobacter oeni LMG 21952]
MPEQTENGDQGAGCHDGEVWKMFHDTPYSRKEPVISGAGGLSAPGGCPGFRRVGMDIPVRLPQDGAVSDACGGAAEHLYVSVQGKLRLPGYGDKRNVE